MLQLFGYDMKQNGSGRSNTNTKPAYVWALCRTLRRKNWDLGICRLKYWGWVGLVGLMESHAMEWGSEFWRLGQVSMDLGSCIMWNLTKLVASTIFYMPFMGSSKNRCTFSLGAHFWEVSCRVARLPGWLPGWFPPSTPICWARSTATSAWGAGRGRSNTWAVAANEVFTMSYILTGWMGIVYAVAYIYVYIYTAFF
jgi:hypothetical protein